MQYKNLDVICIKTRMSQRSSHCRLHTLLTLVPSVTSLTVALAGHRVTAAVSVSTVACFCAVCPPAACVTCCKRHVTFDTERKRRICSWNLQRRLLHCCIVTFPAVVSSPAGSARTPPARHVTASVVLTDTLHLTALTKTPARTCCRTKDRKVETGILGNIVQRCDGAHPKTAPTHLNSSLQIWLPQLGHCFSMLLWKPGSTQCWYSLF